MGDHFRSNVGLNPLMRADAIDQITPQPARIFAFGHVIHVLQMAAENFRMLDEDGIGSIAFCPLAQGLLTSRYLTGIPEDSRASKPHGFLKADRINDETLAKVKALNEIARAREQSLAQMAIAWVLREERVTSALIGASRVSQIEENVAALANLEFSEEEIADIDRITID